MIKNLKTPKGPEQINITCIDTQVTEQAVILQTLNDVIVVMLSEGQKLTLHRDKLHPTYFKCKHQGKEYQCKPH